MYDSVNQCLITIWFIRSNIPVQFVKYEIEDKEVATIDKIVHICAAFNL